VHANVIATDPVVPTVFDTAPFFPSHAWLNAEQHHAHAAAIDFFAHCRRKHNLTYSSAFFLPSPTNENLHQRAWTLINQRGPLLSIVDPNLMIEHWWVELRRGGLEYREFSIYSFRGWVRGYFRDAHVQNQLRKISWSTGGRVHLKFNFLKLKLINFQLLLKFAFSVLTFFSGHVTSVY
jgi:hypothetical protein